MANNQYVIAENWGKGFIEHNESSKINFTGHPGNVWQVPVKNAIANLWISKVLGQLKTKDEAQAIVDAEITAAQTAWDSLPNSEKELTDRPVDITLED
tara:strand:+ start:1388 stop:1681 length:294 start_codon:yes stop_codon:yes gene_type:complete